MDNEQHVLRKLVAWLAALAWLGIAGLGLLYVAYVNISDWTYCQAGDSNYGTLSWSVVPPGPVCTFTLEHNGFDETRGPTPLMSIWLLILVCLGAATVWAIRRAVAADNEVLKERAV